MRNSGRLPSALAQMAWCDCMTPLGNPVVPEVYWMLMASSAARLARRAATSSSLTDAPRSRRETVGHAASLPRRSKNRAYEEVVASVQSDDDSQASGRDQLIGRRNNALNVLAFTRHKRV